MKAGGGRRQTDIASFFGAKPKASGFTTKSSPENQEANHEPKETKKMLAEGMHDGAKEKKPKSLENEEASARSSPSAGKTKRKGNPDENALAMEANEVEKVSPKLKRLKKSNRRVEKRGGSVESMEAASGADHKAVLSAAAKDLEDLSDDGNDQQEKKDDDKNEIISNEQEQLALRKAAAAEHAVSSNNQSEADASSEELKQGSPTDEEAKSASPKSKRNHDGKRASNATSKSPLGKSASSRVEGVGSLAIKAAAEHGTFDLDQLATWKTGQPVPFSFLADTFEAIADESKRLIITGLLVNAFRAVIATTPGDLLPMVYLCTNRVAPAHEGVELGIGDATLIKSLSQATGRKESVIKSDYDSCGDLGVVAAASRATQRTMFAPPALTIPGVFKSFKEIAVAEGAKSQDRKRALIVKLLVGAKQNEAGYVMRALQGKLRIGLAEQTVLVALAHAALLQCKGANGSANELAGKLERAAQIVKSVYSECPSYDELVPALLSDAPIEDLPSKVHFKPGVPIKPMLAKPTTGVSEVLDKFAHQAFTCEYKYDGERAQIHVLENGTVKIYSRNSENNSGKYPDIAATIPEALAPGVKSVVVDAEAVAYDPKAGKVLPFQVLSTRARKDVSLDNIKVPVCVFAFDCLYLNGKALLHESLTVRREALYSALQPIPGRIEFAIAKTSTDIEELSAFLDEAVDAGTEGLIVKTLDDSYEPSKRSSHWLKLKKDYLDGVGDTFDLVPIGAWFGRGKRTGVFGSYLLAVYDPDNEEYQSITKIGTGFSEELLKQLADQMRSCMVPTPPHYYRTPDTLTPDVWFEAKAVWEVKAADLSISPVHRAAAGLVDESKGISIRFPRLVRVREDKGPEESTSPEQIADMYKQQAVLLARKSEDAAEEAD